MTTDIINVRLDLVGGKQASSRVEEQAALFVQRNGLVEVRALLRKHGLTQGNVKVTVVKTVKCQPTTSIFSNISMVGHAIQLRYKPEGEHYFIVKLNLFADCNLSVEEMHTRLLASHPKKKEEATDEQAIARVVEAVSNLQEELTSFTTIDEFTAACLQEIGPAEHTQSRRAFWLAQLNAAESKGLVVKLKNSYVVPHSRETALVPIINEEESQDPWDVLLQAPDLPLLLCDLVDLSRKRKELRDKIAQDSRNLQNVETEMQSLCERIDMDVLKKFVNRLDKMEDN